ncbi:hypothetical protein [Corynebacterium halotolerans]|uniref:Uncharacterized protein n=1 Tax=Corynebacterium halotolerans YIM 70093 = DSM 44683 TaxID=1121362 RepID=M1PB40_9CORY|nr:hypothetical protein [Corynebacterium halotolerans]AGF73881.1 hypothetical protein A605_14557 [Corynebacterium halotolerans YIM 70093 = DSM 44683]
MARRGRISLEARQRQRVFLERQRRTAEAQGAVLLKLGEHLDTITEHEAHAGHQIVRLRELGMTLTTLSETTGLSIRRLNQLIATHEKAERDAVEDEATTPLF